MEIKLYNSKMIAFDFDSETVNATDMLKAFPGKRINDFLRLKQTKDYIKCLESKTGIPVLNVKHGGSKHGTWMNRLLAYDLAAWLSPEFRLFIYTVFDGYMKEKIETQQRQLDYFWDREDKIDIYQRKY